jgi:hypothetical protein
VPAVFEAEEEGVAPQRTLSGRIRGSMNAATRRRLAMLGGAKAIPEYIADFGLLMMKAT